MKRVNLLGQVFGRLTVTGDADGQYWLCSCSCGGEKRVTTKQLKAGKTASCGCLFRDVLVARNRTHGKSRTPTYRSWKDMRARCLNPTDSDFKEYGGRGIKVCDRWEAFESFHADMGDRPDGMTLDRIDVNGDYEPGNCRWADAVTQANNKRSNRLIERGGVVKTLAQWCRETGTEHSKASYRIRHGLDAFSSGDYRR